LRSTVEKLVNRPSIVTDVEREIEEIRFDPGQRAVEVIPNQAERHAR
jgi:hypothetical protein